MSRRGRTTENKSPDSGHLSRRVVMAIVAVLLLTTLTVSGRFIWGWWARRAAAERLEAWAVDDALDWLDRADWFFAQNTTNQLMRARSYRLLGQESLREAALTAAEKLGATSQQLEAERLLGQIQSGEVFEQAERYIHQLSSAGSSPNDIASALVMGCLARQQPSRAAVMLDGWAADLPDQVQTSYMRGVYWQRMNNLPEAQKSLEQALELEPRHELAQVELASLLQRDKRLDDDLTRFVELATRYPRNELALVGLARALRNRGRVDAVRGVLEAAAAGDEPTSLVALEMGQIELESGQYDQACRWLKRVELSTISTGEGISISVIALALAGDPTAAKWTHDRIVDAAAIVRQSQDLRARLTVQPNDQQAAQTLRQLMSTLASKYQDTNPFQLSNVELEGNNPDESPGTRLYRQHCADCHGQNGDGNGRASQYLYPLPRNLRYDRSRLVSSLNGIATVGDVKKVIQLGMPGSSMPAFDELNDEQRTQLAETVMAMRRQGVREELTSRWRSMGEEIEDDELDEIVAALTSPGQPSTAPPFPASTADSVARGQQLYLKHACESCHGKTGEGDELLPLFDDMGMPVAPRNLIHDLFRGGNTPESLYQRIVVGMPGSPHPASAMTVDEATDLIHFVQSLGQDPRQTSTNHQRAIEAMSRPVLE